MGARLKLEEVKQALTATKGLMSLAAERLGCNRQYLYEYVKKHGLESIRDEARAKMVDTAEIALESAVLDKQGWAVCFTLKTLGKDRGYVERQEITGKNGEDLNFTLTINATTDETDQIHPTSALQEAE